MNHIGLFDGIGGFSLPAKWVGWNTVAWCEWNPFCRKILQYWFSEAVGFGDITKSDFKPYANQIDILTGGFPCQGFSLAGKRLGTDDARYLWPEMRRTVKVIQPPWIIGENVTGILSMEDKQGVWREVFPKMESRKIVRYDTIDLYEAVYTRQAKMLVSTICEELEEDGYEVQPFVIPAAAVGAPHRRDRVWFIAYSGKFRDKRRAATGDRQVKISEEKRDKVFESFTGPGFQRPFADPDNEGAGAGFGEVSGADVQVQKRNQNPQSGHENCLYDANPNGTGHKEFNPSAFTDQSGQSAGSHPALNDADPVGVGLRGESTRSGKSGFIDKAGTPIDWSNWPTQSPVCDGNDGISARLDAVTFPYWRNESIKGGGNAVVPGLVFEFYRYIDLIEKS